MKLVINRCFGGFSLSRKAVQRMAELNGRPCYFFKHTMSDGYEADDGNGSFWMAFDIPNPCEVLQCNEWTSLTMEERAAANLLYTKHEITSRPDNRADEILVKVVEELGSDANGSCAELKVVEIPDGIEYEIAEYDGLEHVAQKHQQWS